MDFPVSRNSSTGNLHVHSLVQTSAQVPQIASALSVADCGLADCAKALSTSFDRLSEAANNARELLFMAGFAGPRGDTADDLLTAVAIHEHLLRQFSVKVKTADQVATYMAEADCSFSAFTAAAERHSDAPCGITVTPAATSLPPDRQALAGAHQRLAIAGSLEDALKHPALSKAIYAFARGRQRRALNSTDFKRNAANDRD